MKRGAARDFFLLALVIVAATGTIIALNVGPSGKATLTTTYGPFPLSAVIEGCNQPCGLNASLPGGTEQCPPLCSACVPVIASQNLGICLPSGMSRKDQQPYIDDAKRKYGGMWFENGEGVYRFPSR